MPDDQLRDDCLVVRFNLVDVSRFRKTISECFSQRGYYGVSFVGENGLTAEEIAKAWPFPSEYMCVSTIGRFRAAGFEPARKGKRPHLVLEFEEEPSEEVLASIVGLFDEPIDNPHPR